jgi:IS30 family transposase
MPPRRRHQAFRQLTPFERGRIVGLKEAGCSYRQISGIMNRSVSTVVKCWQAWSVENRDSRAQGSGRPRRTTDRQDRHLRFLAFRDRHM